MGNILVLKGADFSENAVPVENVYDLVKRTDVPTPNYPMTTNYYYNNVVIASKITVYAISFGLPSNADNIDLGKNSVIDVAAVDGSDVLREVRTDISDIITKFKNGQIAGGSVHTVVLSVPLVFNAGEYLAVRPGNDSSFNRCIVYCRTPSGDYGKMVALATGTVENYNLAVNLYGE